MGKKGGGEPKHRRNKMATQGGRFKRRARTSKMFPWSFFPLGRLVGLLLQQEECQQRQLLRRSPPVSCYSLLCHFFFCVSNDASGPKKCSCGYMDWFVRWYSAQRTAIVLSPFWLSRNDRRCRTHNCGEGSPLGHSGTPPSN